MSEADESEIKELLRRIKEGDPRARKQLFELLGDEQHFGVVILAMVRRLLPRHHPARRRVDSHDILQTALGTGFRHFSDFRGDTEGELYAWFRSIIRTKVNRVARQKNPEDLEEVRKRARGKRTRLPLSELIDRELIDTLYDAIAQLPVEQRLVVELRLRGINATEIGELLNLKPATVRKRESRAAEKLKTLVG